MGRRPKSKDEKIAAGTYRKDRDNTVTVSILGEIPDPPDTIGDRGRELWQHAYDQPWVTLADKTLVQLVAEKLDERQQVADQFQINPADFRHQRTLKEIDRDILHGLDQLLLTPNARKRAGLQLAEQPEPYPTPLQLMMKRSAGELNKEDYDRLMEPHRKAEERKLREESEREMLENARDASTRTLAALMDPDGYRRKSSDQT